MNYYTIAVFFTSGQHCRWTGPVEGSLRDVAARVDQAANTGRTLTLSEDGKGCLILCPNVIDYFMIEQVDAPIPD